MSDEIDQILEAFLHEARPIIERVVSRALNDGRAISELAVDLQRGADDQIRGGCAPRGAVAKRWRSHPELDDEKRTELADLIAETGPDEIPVAMSIVAGRFKVFGVKRLEGDVIPPAKSN